MRIYESTWEIQYSHYPHQLLMTTWYKKQKFKAYSNFLLTLLKLTNLRYRDFHYVTARCVIYIHFGGLKKVQKVGKLCQTQSKSDLHFRLLTFNKAIFSIVKSSRAKCRIGDVSMLWFKQSATQSIHHLLYHLLHAGQCTYSWVALRKKMHWQRCTL